MSIVSEDGGHLRRILLVEDHADTRDLLVRLLSPTFDVRTAECFDSAMACAAKALPDLVVTDVGLPGRDGISLMRELHDRYQIPGIAVTGHLPEDPSQFRRAGFAAYLTKPIRFDELLRVVNSALDQHGKTRVA